jgi:PAS domain S-box-containing protein
MQAPPIKTPRRLALRYLRKYGLILLVIAALFLPLIGYQIRSAWVVARDAAATEAQNLALVIEAKLAADFESADQAVSDLAASVDPQAMRSSQADLHRAEITRRLKDDLRHISTASALRLFDSHGDRLYTSADDENPVNIADRKFFTQLKNEATASTRFSEVTIGKISGNVSLFIGKAIRDPAGNFLGVGFSEINLTVMREHFRGIDLGRNGAIALYRLDSGALVVRFPGPVEVDNRPRPDLPIKREIERGTTGGMTDAASPIDGVHRMVGYRKVGRFPFFVAVGIAEDEFLAQWRKEAMAALMATISFLAVLAAVFYKLARADFRRDLVENRLRETEERYSALFIESKSIMLMISPGDGQIIEANPAALRFYGHDHERLCRMNLSDLMLRSRDETRSVIQILLANSQTPCLLKSRLANGQIRQVEIAAGPFRYRNKTIVYAIINDVSERETVAAELARHRAGLEALVSERTAALTVAKAAAEAANHAKSTFLANMSHELRTPMNAIMGMTHLAMRRATDERQIDELGRAIQASQHLLAVINDILDISKIEAEHLDLERVEFNLAMVLADLTNLTGERAANKGLALITEISAEQAALPLIGDPMRLRQILVNLVGNALKFTSQGTITVRARVENETVDQVRFHFEVKDTGIGIADEVQKRLFKAFEQADNSMTRRYGGTGLGLAICKRLVEMMGGQIGVRSQAGVGSTFWFNVCFAKVSPVVVEKPSAASISAEDHLKKHHAGKRILFAEDEPTNQVVTRALIEIVGLSVDIAEDGVKALAMVSQNHYDLILMDMEMPNMDGLDTTRAIRRAPGNADLPIIAMTANAFADDKERCLRAGMNDFITKPVDPDRLFSLIGQWLDRQEPTKFANSHADGFEATVAPLRR